jgi:hypothetical protein
MLPMKRTIALFVCIFLGCLSPAGAGVVVTVTQGEEGDLAAFYSETDLLQGLIATELAGDRGWHQVNQDPADRLPAFTDGVGVRSTGLTGLLNDFPPPGEPAKRLEYELTVPSDISEVRVFTGNNGRDGRVFHTYTVAFSTDNGASFGPPIYVQSHPSGTLNNNTFNQWRVVLSSLRDDSGVLVRRATHVQFDFYAVDNTQGQCRDPFDGANPFTGVDDGLSAPITSPLVWEIDLFGSPLISAVRSGADLQLRWIAESPFVIQFNTGFDPAGWADMEPQPLVDVIGATNTATIPIGSENLFLRLRN